MLIPSYKSSHECEDERKIHAKYCENAKKRVFVIDKCICKNYMVYFKLIFELV